MEVKEIIKEKQEMEKEITSIINNKMQEFKLKTDVPIDKINIGILNHYKINNQEINEIELQLFELSIDIKL